MDLKLLAHRSAGRCCGSASLVPLHAQRRFGLAGRGSAAFPAPAPQRGRGASRAKFQLFAVNSEKGVWARADSHVYPLSGDEAERLYCGLSNRTNEQHVLVVAYDPACAACAPVAEQVERLAQALAADSSVVVAKLNMADAAAGKFGSEVLSIQGTPSFLMFPRQSRTFYHYKGQAKSAEALMSFMNMTCKSNDSSLWDAEQLLQAGSTTSTSAAASFTRSIAAYLPGSGSLSSAGVVGAAAGSVVLAILAVRALTARILESATQNKDVADLDSSIGKMLSLAWRMVCVRLALLLLPPEGAAPSPAAASRSPGQQPQLQSQLQQTPAASSATKAVPPPAPAKEPATGVARRAIAAFTAFPLTEEEMEEAGVLHDDSTAPPDEDGWERVADEELVSAAEALEQQALGDQAAEQEEQEEGEEEEEDALEDLAVDLAMARAATLPGQAMEAALTKETVRVAGLDAQQVLMLLNKQGASAGSVADELLSQSNLLRLEQQS